MRIDEFTADEFLTSAQLLAEVAEEAMGGKLGEEVKRAFVSYRAAAKAVKAEAGDEADAKAKVEMEAVDMVAGLLPVLLREGGELSLKFLAALDGQTLEEYKACFSMAKYAADIKAALDGIDSVKEIAAPFFSLAADDPELLWLCMGEYTGPRRARPFARYLSARQRREAEGAAYRVYLTESIRLAVQSRYIATPYLELVRGAAEPADTRSGDEIAADVIDKLGLKVV